jgi:peptidoglycan/LPS O-acetylase OafA/YrhL
LSFTAGCGKVAHANGGAMHKLASLDALRGLAILFVIIAHFGAGEFGRNASIVFGNAGVILFFFLSGFLMDRALNQDRNLVSYGLRRAFRILPMYWVSLAVVALWSSDWTPWQLVANATFTAPAFGLERMLGVYWTLYIEVLFYALAPVLALGGRLAIGVATYAALALFAAFAFMHGVEKGAGFYLIFCLAGMQIGAWHRHEISALQLSVSILTVCAGASLLMPASSIYLSPISIYLGPIALCCAALVVAGLHFRLRFPMLAFFGTVSYSWYLLHSIFGYKLAAYPIAGWFAMLIGAALTLAVSVVTYRYVEAPAIAFGKRLGSTAALVSMRRYGWFGGS